MATRLFQKLRCTRFLDIAYDAAICLFSVVDIFCDVFVTLQFYRSGHTIFFGISCFILFLAQIAYALLMCVVLEPVIAPSHWCTNQSYFRKYVILFVATLPVGQLVPLFLMISNAFPQSFDAFYNKIGYRDALRGFGDKLFHVHDQRGAARKKHDGHNESDPLSLYIRHKLVSHLGFIIEALIEAIPQSILQMVFFVMYASDSDSVSVIHIVSIVMSMSVVASKGTILCYSIYRSAAVFNFVCFSIDIFGIFCVCSWLFCSSSSSSSDDSLVSLPYEMFGFSMSAAAYFYFNALRRMLQCITVAGVCAIIMAIADSYNLSPNHPWRQWGKIAVFTLWCSFLFFPICLICLMVRFTLLPLLVLRTFDHSRNRSFQFYNVLFHFLTSSSSISEMHEKLQLTHWVFATLLNTPGEIVANEEQSLSLSFMYRALQCHVLAKYHQILEILALLFSRKGLWAYLFIKFSRFFCLNATTVKLLFRILRCCCVPLRADDISFVWADGANSEQYVQQKFEAIEREFYKTVHDIQVIINWDDFSRQVRTWMDNLFNTDYQVIWTRFKNKVCVRCRRFKACFTRSRLQACAKWFWYDGLYMAIKQDLTNLYRTMVRCTITRKPKQTLPRRYYWNQQISTWEIPPSWRSLFRRPQPRQTRRQQKVSANRPWVGDGIYVFLIVAVFECIHKPIKNVLTSRIDSYVGPVLSLCLISIALLLLFLAAYSVFLPIIFIAQHWLQHGLLSVQYNVLQTALTSFYIVLLGVLVFLFCRVWKFVYCDVHLFRFFDDRMSTPVKYAHFVVATYEAAQQRNGIVIGAFGADIGGIILSFSSRCHIVKEQLQLVKTDN